MALLPLQRAFASEAAYLTFSENYVGSCLAALTVAVGKDVVWKPLNHKVLLTTRDSKKAVRVASVKILHQLFSEVSCIVDYSYSRKRCGKITPIDNQAILTFLII